MSGRLGTRRRGKVGSRVARYVWRVIAVLGNGHGHGDCGHNHKTSLTATRCRWAPPDWDDHIVCDLLVRKFRDRRGEPVRTRRRAA